MSTNASLQGHLVVFLGPTISPADARVELDAVFLPPVSQGDFYRAALRGPRAIGVIDGYFHQVPAIWHKEILWAIAQGIHVYGASSMGALRGAELASFGMIGVGKIFEDFRDGVLEDDDEVAVVHGPADTGYRALGEAMVNVRATLARAAAEGIVDEPARAAVEAIAKDLYYMDRTWPAIVNRLAKEGLADKYGVDAPKLAEWVKSPRNRVDQKRADAIAMLRRMRADHLEVADPPKSGVATDFHLEYTTFWDQLVQSAGASASQASSPAEVGGVETSLAAVTTTITADAVLDELRLAGTPYLEAREAATARGLALQVAQHTQSGSIADGDLTRVKDEFRRARDLHAEGALEEWLADNQLAPAQLDNFLREEALLAITAGDPGLARRHLPHHLRATNRYASLHARARDKRQRLEEAGLWNAKPGEPGVGIDREGLIAWYLDRAPSGLPRDLRHHARVFDFEDGDRLLSAVLREYCYRRLTDSRGT
jgi:hypothetical protein